MGVSSGAVAPTFIDSKGRHYCNCYPYFIAPKHFVDCEKFVAYGDLVRRRIVD